MPKPHKLIKCGPGGKKCPCCCPPPGDRARRYLFKQAQRRDEELALEEGMMEALAVVLEKNADSE